MAESKKKGTGEVRTLAAWAAAQVLAEEELHRLVAKQIEGLLASLERARIRLPFGIREKELAADFRTKVQALLVWAEVWHSLAAGKSPAEIALPLPLTEGKAGSSLLIGRPAGIPSPEPWLIFDLTEEQWRTSIHNLLLRAPSGGTAAAGNALSRVGIRTVGDFYERWQGDAKFPFGIIRNFGRVRLAQVKRALEASGISLPVPPSSTDESDESLRQVLGLDAVQWDMSTRFLFEKFGGGSSMDTTVRDYILRLGCNTVGELARRVHGPDGWHIANFGPKRHAYLQQLLAKANIDFAKWDQP